MEAGQIIAQLILWLIVAVIVIAIIYWVMHWLYRRSTKETAFVRTGFLGEKVVVDGGAFVWPIIHDITPVNMNTLALRISRTREDAMISHDHVRVDVEADFFVRVAPDRDSVSIAASRLGRRTLNRDEVQGLLEGKFESALRSVVAELDLATLQEQRHTVVQRIKETVQEDLKFNGLELETVAILDIDQAALEFFNPSNRFDAEGMTALIRDIEEKRRLRNDIEQNAMIQIRSRKLEAERETLNIDRESEHARLEQEREIELRRAQQQAEIARERAERETEAENARIAAREATETARIATERAIRSQEIDRNRQIDAAEIEAREATEQARLAQDRSLTAARITHEQEIKALEIARTEALEAAEIAAQEATERQRIAQQAKISEVRISEDQRVRAL